MDRNYERALELVLKHEGGFVNHPADPGGATNLGITIGVAKRLGIDVDGDGDTDIVDIKKLRREDAAKVYRAEYWNKVRGDDLPDGVDYAVFDFAVNSGPARAAKYLQAIVGVKQDGKIGPQTLAAVAAMPNVSIINQLCDNRQDFVEGLSTFKTFGKGWTARIKGVRQEALGMAALPHVPPIKPIPPLGPIPPPSAKPGGINWLAIIIFALVAAALAAFFFLPILK